MNPDYGALGVGLVAGAAIGLVYFGGLWLTVRRLPARRRPHLWLLGSFVLRLGLALAAFYLLVPLGWQALATGLAGLLAARQVLVRARGLGAAGR